MGRIMNIRDRALQSKDAINLLSNKWQITILHILREGVLRTNEIQGAIVEVAPKVLTQTLRGIYGRDNDYVFPSVKLSGKCPRSASMLVGDYIRPAAIQAGILIERDARPARMATW